MHAAGGAGRCDLVVQSHVSALRTCSSPRASACTPAAPASATHRQRRLLQCCIVVQQLCNSSGRHEHRQLLQYTVQLCSSTSCSTTLGPSSWLPHLFAALLREVAARVPLPVHTLAPRLQRAAADPVSSPFMAQEAHHTSSSSSCASTGTIMAAPASPAAPTAHNEGVTAAAALHEAAEAAGLLFIILIVVHTLSSCRRTACGLLSRLGCHCLLRRRLCCRRRLVGCRRCRCCRRCGATNGQIGLLEITATRGRQRGAPERGALAARTAHRSYCQLRSPRSRQNNVRRMQGLG